MKYLALACACLAGAATAGEIGFEEKFALAKDRETAMKELIPGSDDHYYYQCGDVGTNRSCQNNACSQCWPLDPICAANESSRDHAQREDD